MIDELFHRGNWLLMNSRSFCVKFGVIHGSKSILVFVKEDGGPKPAGDGPKSCLNIK